MRQRRSHKAAFTMVETLVSVATMGLLMTGMGSAILIASNSLPDRGNPVYAAIKAADAVDQVVAGGLVAVGNDEVGAFGGRVGWLYEG